MLLRLPSGQVMQVTRFDEECYTCINGSSKGSIITAEMYFKSDLAEENNLDLFNLLRTHLGENVKIAQENGLLFITGISITRDDIITGYEILNDSISEFLDTLNWLACNTKEPEINHNPLVIIDDIAIADMLPIKSFGTKIITMHNPCDKTDRNVYVYNTPVARPIIVDKLKTMFPWIGDIAYGAITKVKEPEPPKHKAHLRSLNIGNVEASSFLYDMRSDAVNDDNVIKHLASLCDTIDIPNNCKLITISRISEKDSIDDQSLDATIFDLTYEDDDSFVVLKLDIDSFNSNKELTDVRKVFKRRGFLRTRSTMFPNDKVFILKNDNSKVRNVYRYLYNLYMNDDGLDSI